MKLEEKVDQILEINRVSTRFNVIREYLVDAEEAYKGQMPILARKIIGNVKKQLKLLDKELT